MPHARSARQRRLVIVRLSLAFAVLGLCMATILFLVFDVRTKIENQATASSDNVQWTLSQIEVEYLRLVQAAESAQIPREDRWSEVRRRFDVFYSRVATLREGGVYSNLRNQTDFAGQLDRVSAGLDALIPIIDGPDSLLQQQLPYLTERISTIGGDVRNLGLSGLRAFADVSDASRLAVWLTLLRVAGLTVVLIVALLGLAVVLFRLYRLSDRQAVHNRETSSRLEAILASTLDAVIAVDDKGVIVEFNGAATDVLGYSQAEAIGTNMSDLIVPGHLRSAHEVGMERYRQTGIKKVVGKGRIELQARRKDGSNFPVELSISAAQTADGELFVSFMRDISARVAADAELLKARDDALAGEKAKAELLAVMSHEMRTPLNGMLGTMQLMSDSPLTRKQQDYLRIMETSGKLLLHHVNDVLDISRIDAGKVDIDRRPFDLDLVLTEIVDSQRGVAAANGNTLTLDLAGIGNTTVLGDQTRLRQILLNLVSNAIKFTRNGTVAIEVEPLGKADLFEFRVSDTGIGISEANLTRIFEDFVTLDTSYARDSGGTGLGLGIAKRLARMMGGELGAESEQGEGSLFWLRLPLPILSVARPATRKTRSRKARAAATPVRPLDLLVVEDNAINRMVVEEMLGRDGHTVTLANDGKEGVATAGLRRFDAILMDISMPHMDGVQATKIIRGSTGPNQDTPIIALTAHALPDDIARFRAAGMQDTLVKPISRDQLTAVLSSHSQDMAVATAPACAPPPAPAEIIDRAMLLERCDSLGFELASRLCNAFVAEADSAVEDLSQPDRMTDADIIAMAHKIAGSSGMFGATALHDLLGRIETAGKTGQAVAMRRLLADLAPIWTQTRTGMRDLQEAHRAGAAP